MLNFEVITHGTNLFCKWSNFWLEQRNLSFYEQFMITLRRWKIKKWFSAKSSISRPLPMLFGILRLKGGYLGSLIFIIFWDGGILLCFLCFFTSENSNKYPSLANKFLNWYWKILRKFVAIHSYPPTSIWCRHYKLINQWTSLFVLVFGGLHYTLSKDYI